MNDTTQRSSDAVIALPGFRLDGRVALVTGASAGLGAAIGSAMAQAGAEVILLARGREALERVIADITAAGGKARAIVCDATDREALRAHIAALPRLDILVNNTGTNFAEPIADVTDAHLDAMIDLNIRAIVVAAQAAVAKMRERQDRPRGEAVIINMSSQMGHVGSPNRTIYCMSKHAVEGFTKALAVELAPEGIRVVSIAPTFVDTPLVRRVVNTPEKQQFVLSRIPMGQLARLEDVAAAALYLASPAAAMVTGTSLVVDGGWTAQ